MAFTTRKSLLERIRDGNEISWEEFYQNYRPLILLRGGDLGLAVGEKEELVQIVMAEVFKGRASFLYDRSHGRFRDYLKAIIHNQAVNLLRQRRNVETPLDRDDFVQDNRLEEHWNDEWRGHLLQMALAELKNQVEPLTFQAFMLYAVQERKCGEVADFLDISNNSVYVAKSRCLDMLKTIILRLDENE